MEYLGYERFYLAYDGQKYLASLQRPKARGTSGTSGEAAEKNSGTERFHSPFSLTFDQFIG